ncbi:hypothetical protein BJ992_003113 [Sphaerisporangium rubeum]|uniref:Uncharacterized protein n=1 Tax=Sphaerisporangium rubeum TaxID=321317 RepID=A0A7X0IHC1_9ACTN|nr:hypothetical protein [Sphaerisporangium rubeum]
MTVPAGGSRVRLVARRLARFVNRVSRTVNDSRYYDSKNPH